MVNPKLYDVVIIGAGPAGTTVAYELKDTDLSIAILDKATFPRAKPCAGVLPPRIFSELYIPEVISERELNGYRLFSPSGEVVESEFSRPGLIVDRKRFDEFLVKRIGIELIQDQVSGLKKQDNHLEVIGNNNSYRAKIVIGADGVNSVVRKFAGISLETVAIAAQYDISIPENEIDNRIGNWFEVYYTIRNGYGWLSPFKDKVKVGVGGVSNGLKKNAKKVLDNFLKQPPIKAKVGSGKVEGFELHRIPMSGPLYHLCADRTLLIGDAGGFVYPGTGEGIYYAIKSGRLAVKVILKAIERQKYDAEYLEQLYIETLGANGLLSLRDVDFIEKVLSTSENCEKYLRKLKRLSS